MITDTNKGTTKKAWQTPEIIDLDIPDKTCGKNPSTEEGGPADSYGPS